LGLRAYVLIKAQDNLDQEKFSRCIADLENKREVDFVDVTVGSKDVVVVMECASNVDSFVQMIESSDWVECCDVLRVINKRERKAAKGPIEKPALHAGL